jgi:methionyl aminopeptidase
MVLIKTIDEINGIRESCQIVADVLKLVEKYIKEGVTTKELDSIGEEFIISCGARPAFKGYRPSRDYTPYPASLCISINEEVVHGIPSDRMLGNGDIVSVDVGVLKNSFFGDGAKTFAVGSISDAKKKLMDVTEKSLYLGIEQAKAGNKLFDISKAVQEYVELNNCSVVRDLTGHGVGKHLHEPPQIPNYVPKKSSGKQNVLLKEGMTLAIEPMVNYGGYEVKTKRDGWTVYARDMMPSAHFEHTILIRDGAPEILTV